jgi:hypothetical protein
LVPSHQAGALLAEPLIGVIVRVGHLTIGHPNDSISVSPQQYGVL